MMSSSKQTQGLQEILILENFQYPVIEFTCDSHLFILSIFQITLFHLKTKRKGLLVIYSLAKLKLKCKQYTMRLNECAIL